MLSFHYQSSARRYQMTILPVCIHPTRKLVSSVPNFYFLISPLFYVKDGIYAILRQVSSCELLPYQYSSKNYQLFTMSYELSKSYFDSFDLQYNIYISFFNACFYNRNPLYAHNIFGCFNSMQIRHKLL